MSLYELGRTAVRLQSESDEVALRLERRVFDLDPSPAVGEEDIQFLEDVQFSIEPRPAPPTPRQGRTNRQAGPLSGGLDGVTAALAKVAQLIPAEALATYIAVTALLDSKSNSIRWVCFGIGGALVAFFVWLGNSAGRRETGETPDERLLMKTLAFGMIAYVVYGLALPASPFLSIGGYNLRIGGVAVIVASVVLPPLAARWGVIPGSAHS